MSTPLRNVRKRYVEIDRVISRDMRNVQRTSSAVTRTMRCSSNARERRYNLTHTKNYVPEWESATVYDCLSQPGLTTAVCSSACFCECLMVGARTHCNHTRTHQHRIAEWLSGRLNYTGTKDNYDTNNDKKR